MGHNVHAPDGAGVVAQDNMPEAPKRFWTKVVQLSVVHHQPEEDGKFSDGANGQCWWNGQLSWYAAKLQVGEERHEEGTLKPLGVKSFA